MGSAICSFTIDDIQAAFKGKFKEQATSSSAWLPVLSNRVPEPRPGECVNDTETLPGEIVLIFSRQIQGKCKLIIVIQLLFPRFS
jgi:hypothetical protein